MSDREFGRCPGEQDPACSGRGDGLQVHLLLVDDVRVVEGGVGGVEFVEDRRVEWVGRLCHFEV